MYYLEMPQSPEAKAFSVRLNELADDLRLPPKHAGRQTVAGKRWHVSQAAARKWFEGESIPEMQKVIRIAMDGGICVEWLLTSRGPKRPGEKAPTLVATEPPAPAFEKRISAEHSELLNLFDSLTAAQQNDAIEQLRETVEANLAVLREIGGRVRAHLENGDSQAWKATGSD